MLGLRIVSEHYRKERDSWKADCWLGSTYANIVQAVKKCYKQNFDSGVYGSVFICNGSGGCHIFSHSGLLCTPKGLLLECKEALFKLQNDYYCNAIRAYEEG